ncbi:MAG: hypothetical protein GY847_22195 [Proteobacteria bacterium]|nr:hypothetical protein [Pseudomonadota bacterium]
MVLIVGSLALAVNGIFAQVKEFPEPVNKERQTTINDVREAETVESKELARLMLPVAKIKGNPLTVYYIESAAAGEDLLKRLELADRTKQNEFLDDLIREEVLAAEAKRRGYDAHEEVQELLKLELARLAELFIKNDIVEVAPTDDELSSYYKEHLNYYHKPEMISARHILISDKDKAQRLLNKLLESKPSEKEFQRLVQNKGEKGEMRLKGGNLGFLPKPGSRHNDELETSAVLAEAVFKLTENGEIFKQLVKTKHGFHILMRTGHKPEEKTSFKRAMNQGLPSMAKSDIRQQKVEAKIQALKDTYPVQVYEENFKYVVVDLPDDDGREGRR